MSRISLKTDYEDGKVLNAGELNVNNNVTMLGVNDNFERISKLGSQKADIVYVDNKISEKADLSLVNNSVRELTLIKADKSELVTKADKSEVDSKANLTYVNEQLATKANLSYVTAQLNSKVDVDDLENSLNLKADKTTIGNLSSLKTDDKSSIVNAINSINREATPIATIDTVGLVKPDGTTTTVDADGTIHAVGGGGGGSGTSDYEALSNKPLINNVELKGNVSLEDLNLMDKDTLEEALNSKANSNNVYSKNYIDTNVISVLNDKADSSSVNAALALKANSSDVYSKSTVDELLEAQGSSYDAKLLAKADTSSVYTKQEIDAKVDKKADGLSFSDNQLQLKSGDELIGNSVTVKVATSDIAISPEQPTGDDWKLWIPSDQVENISEVVDSLDGNYTNLSPSVRAIKSIYPIGSVYISFNTENPNKIFGGTWEQLSDIYIDNTNLIIDGLVKDDGYASITNTTKLQPGKYIFSIKNNGILSTSKQYQLFILNASNDEKTHFTKYVYESLEFEITDDEYSYIYVFVNTSIANVRLSLLNNNDNNVMHCWKRKV